MLPRQTLVVFCVLLGSASMADGIIIRAELTPELDEVDAPVCPGTQTWITVPTPITSFGGGNQRDYRIVQTSPSRLDVDVADGALPSNVNIEMLGGRQVSVRFYMTTSNTKAASRVEFYEPGTMPTGANGGTDPRIGEVIVHAHHIDGPIEIPWQAGGHHLLLRTGFAVHADTSVLPVELHSQYGYPLTRLELRDHLDRPIDAEIIYGVDPSQEPVEIRPGQTASTVFHIKDPHQIADGWTLIATATTAIPPARFSWEPRQDKGPLEKRVAIAIHLSGGTSKLDTGVGDDENAWTLLQGFGARVTYGMSRNLSIDAAVDYTRTDEARFPNTMWDQNQGELQVRETAGRVLAGGLLHTAGRRWLPFARVAVGVRVSKHQLAMGSRAESEIRAGALFGFGGGLNVMLGRRAMAGLAGLYIAPMGGDDSTQSFEANVSLAALWDL